MDQLESSGVREVFAITQRKKTNALGEGSKGNRRRGSMVATRMSSYGDIDARHLVTLMEYHDGFTSGPNLDIQPFEHLSK